MYEVGQPGAGKIWSRLRRQQEIKILYYEIITWFQKRERGTKAMSAF